MRGAGRGVGGWGQGRLRTTQGQTGQKSKAAAQVGAVQPRPVPRGAVQRLAGPPQRGRQGLGRPARQGSPARALRLPPPMGKRSHRPQGAPAEQQSRSWGAGHPEGEAGPCKGHICASAKEAPCPLFSRAVPRHLRMEWAGWQAPRSGPGWKGMGHRKRHEDTWHKEGSHHTLSVGSCRGHMVASSGLSPRAEVGRALPSGPGLQLRS